MKPPRSASLLLMLLLGHTGSFAQKVKTNFDSSVDFKQFHTYAWRQHPIFEKKPYLQEQFSVAIQLVTSAVNQGLRNKGYLRADDPPDFYATFFITARGMQDVQIISTGGWYGWGSFWYPGWTEVMSSPYVDGTLVLDFVKSSTKQLAWRAYCEGEIHDMTKRHEVIEKSVKKALKKFPPKA